MTFLPDTNACISLLHQKQSRLIARWQSTKVTDIVLCSVVVYELRHGAESSAIHDVNTRSWTRFSPPSPRSRSMTHAR